MKPLDPDQFSVGVLFKLSTTSTSNGAFLDSSLRPSWLCKAALRGGAGSTAASAGATLPGGGGALQQDR